MDFGCAHAGDLGVRFVEELGGKLRLGESLFISGHHFALFPSKKDSILDRSSGRHAQSNHGRPPKGSPASEVAGLG
jgi:hypothetical protein